MDELLSKLTSLGVDEAKAKDAIEKAKSDGVTDLASAALLTEAEWTGYGLPKITARKLIAELAKATAPAPAPVPAAAAAAPALSLLPVLPDDGDFLKQLQVGGVLKPQPTDVAAAVRVLFAQRFGLFDIEDRLIAAMEQRAEEAEESFPDVYYQVRKSLRKKAHAEVLEALDVPGAVVSERNKRAFLGRLEGIWDVLTGFQSRIDAYNEAWMTKIANPGMLMASFAALARGGAAMMPGGMTDAPDTAPVVDAATGVIDAVNRMFSGAGIPVARALAADAVQLRTVLEKPELVGAVGATSREEMLKKLGLAVSADVVRSEKSVAQFVLGVVKLPEVEQTQLPLYIGALKELGSTIPWDSLRGGRAVASDGTSRTPGYGRQKATY